MLFIVGAWEIDEQNDNIIDVNIVHSNRIDCISTMRSLVGNVDKMLTTCCEISYLLQISEKMYQCTKSGKILCLSHVSAASSMLFAMTCDQ